MVLYPSGRIGYCALSGCVWIGLVCLSVTPFLGTHTSHVGRGHGTVETGVCVCRASYICSVLPVADERRHTGAKFAD